MPRKCNTSVFSSPELKTQMSFSDHLSSVNFSHYHLLLQNHWANFGTNYPWVKGIQVCSNEGPHPSQRGDYCEMMNINWQLSKNLLLQNHIANFIRTWHKVSLGEGDLILCKWRATPFSKGRLLWNIKSTLRTFKNLLLQNHWAIFDQTRHKASSGEDDSSLFKWRVMPFSKCRLLITAKSVTTSTKSIT